MEGFIDIEVEKGDVVIFPFPFTDLTTVIKRPAIIIADLQGHDVILCQVTSKFKFDTYCLELEKADFVRGFLKKSSFIRTNKLFTAHRYLLQHKIGKINSKKIKQIENKLVDIFTS